MIKGGRRSQAFVIALVSAIAPSHWRPPPQGPGPGKSPAIGTRSRFGGWSSTRLSWWFSRVIPSYGSIETSFPIRPPAHHTGTPARSLRVKSGAI